MASCSVAGAEALGQLVNGHADVSSNPVNGDHQSIEVLEDDRVLIAGGGPVGLVLAKVLSYYGIKSLVLERNPTTTRFVWHPTHLNFG